MVEVINCLGFGLCKVGGDLGLVVVGFLMCGCYPQIFPFPHQANIKPLLNS